jgi:hypothetical protein
MYATLHPGSNAWRTFEGVPTAEQLNTIVGGLFDAVAVAMDGTDEITLWCHDEGLLLQFDPCLDIIRAEHPTWRQVLVGPLVATRTDMTNGETVSLKGDDLETFLALSAMRVLCEHEDGSFTTNALLEVP